MKPHRSKWRPNAGYFSLDEDCAFVLKKNGCKGGRIGGEVKSALSLVNHRLPFSPLSTALPLRLLEVVCVFEVRPFVLRDCAELEY